jgi:Tol biopolymer transport system component
MRIPMLALKAVSTFAATSALLSACNDESATSDPSQNDARIHGLADAARDAIALDGSDPIVPILDAGRQYDVQARDTLTPDGALDMQVPPEIRLRRLTAGFDGNEINAGSLYPEIGGNGNVVIFSSHASNLVPNDNNNHTDIFAWHHRTGRIQRVNIGINNMETNNASNNTFLSTLAINHDGTVIVFESWADNLVDIQLEAMTNVYVRDLNENRTELMNIAPDGSAGNQETGRDFTSVTADGRFVVFTSAASNLVLEENERRGKFIFIRDRIMGTMERLSFMNDGALNAISGSYPTMSNDGRFVALSTDDPLTPDDHNNRRDIYILDRQTSTVERVSVGLNNEEANDTSTFPAIDNSGNYVVFWSDASNLVENDNNELPDIFLRDREGSTTKRINVSANGDVLGLERDRGDLDRRLGNHPRFSGNGRFAVFASSAQNIGGTEFGYGVFVYDRLTERTVFITHGDRPDINEKGDVIAFVCEGGNICIAEIGALFE